MLKIAFDPKYILDLPLNHRFPMSKYELIPQQLLYEGIVEKKNFFSPNKIADHWLEAAHDSCLLYTSPSPRDPSISRMPSSA